jgi:hypothetical protein
VFTVIVVITDKHEFNKSHDILGDHVEARGIVLCGFHFVEVHIMSIVN